MIYMVYTKIRQVVRCRRRFCLSTRCSERENFLRSGDTIPEDAFTALQQMNSVQTHPWYEPQSDCHFSERRHPEEENIYICRKKVANYHRCMNIVEQQQMGECVQCGCREKQAPDRNIYCIVQFEKERQKPKQFFFIVNNTLDTICIMLHGASFIKNSLGGHVKFSYFRREDDYIFQKFERNTKLYRVFLLKKL